MLSRMLGFISRHRRKFFGVAVASAFVWGGWSYFNWRMRRYEEEYVREVLNRAKRHMHHTSSAQAAEKQAVALIPVATRATNRALDTNTIVCELKGATTNEHKEKLNNSSASQSKKGKQLTYEEKIAKWDELKRITVARAVAYAYVPSMLIVFLRLQLGLLGGYVFRSCGGDNVDAFLNGGEEKQKKGEKKDSMPVEIQEAYLSLSQYFLEGKSSAPTKQLENPSKSPQETLLCESYWAEHRRDQDTVKGKSKLNLNFPIATLNAAGSETCSFSSHSHKDQLSHSVKRPIELEKQGSSGDLENVSECPSGIAVESSSSCSRIQEEKKESSSYEEKTSSLSDKEHILPNGETDSCVSSGSGVQGCELTPVGVSDDEIGDQKESSSKDVVEEDSGRCSGIDEEEVLEDRMMNSGIELLCSLLEKKVGRVVDGTSLKMQLSLADTETLFWGMLTSIRANPAEDPAFNLPKYLLPPPDVLKGMADELEAQLDTQASSLFLEMISETADLLETKEVVELLQSCVSAGFGHIMDKLATHFPQDPFGLPGIADESKGTTEQVQMNSSQQTIPMAKLIPIINKVAFEEGTPWFMQLLEMSNLKDFGANVYEAFTH